jgi:excisionase family DNA binding protein
MSVPDPVTDVRERLRRRAKVRLRQLEKAIDEHPADDALWSRYFEAAQTYLALDPPGEALITTEQLATRLGVSPETIRERVKEGRLAPAAMFGRRGGYRFRPGQRPT